MYSAGQKYRWLISLVVPVKNSVPSDKNSTWNPTCFHIYGEHLYVLTYTKANVLTKAKHTIGILHTPRSLNLQQQITDYKYHRRLGLVTCTNASRVSASRDISNCILGDLQLHSGEFSVAFWEISSCILGDFQLHPGRFPVAFWEIPSCIPTLDWKVLVALWEICSRRHETLNYLCWNNMHLLFRLILLISEIAENGMLK